MDYLTLFLYISPLIVFIYLYINRKYSYWSDQGIAGPPSVFPFGYVLTRFMKDPFEIELDYTKKYGKAFGVYNGLIPTLTISDVELVKTVLVKDFHLFVNRRRFNVLDRYWSKNLFFAHDDVWKRIRSIATPAFSSGKLRKMFPLLKQSADKLEKYLQSVVDNTADHTFNVKDVMAGFTIDVIASTSFGTDTDTNGDRSKFNPFLHHGQRMFQKVKIHRLLFILTLPTLALKALKIEHAFPHDSFEFFINVIKTMLKRDGQRQDLITLLKEANISEDELKNMNYSTLTASSELEQKSEAASKPEVSQSTTKNKFLTEEEIIAQCILFFIAGFETTGSAITHTLFELAKNEDIQQRLYDEVVEKLSDVDPEEDLDSYYETITHKIPYLDAVIKETLRMYPPVPRLERSVAADQYKLGNATLQKGNLVEISTIAVHYDPDYYSEPHEYNPERFLPENKHKLVPYSYLPFGDGPRNCVGMRFAYQEAKICLASLIQKFSFHKCESTPDKLSFPRQFGIVISHPFNLTVKSRQ